MDVYPQDLGKKNCERVRCHRAAFVPGVAEWAAPEDTSSRTGRWARSVGVAFLLAIVLSRALYVPILPIFGFLLMVFGLSALLFDTIRRTRKTAACHGPGKAQGGNKSLSFPDVLRLRETSDDPLQGKYLDLVQTALLLPPPSEAPVERTVRAAIHALGTAIEGLPRHSSSLLTDNPGVLNAEADRLAALSQTEPDAVIAASLERRAGAYAHRAETVIRAQTLLRRNDALRDEMADQVDALRTSLIASGITREIEDAGLTVLAANVQRIATEVNALSAARTEVEDALHGVPPRAADQPTRVRLRKYSDEIHIVVDKNVTHPGG